jgi:hypothetical protein
MCRAVVQHMVIICRSLWLVPEVKPVLWEHLLDSRYVLELKISFACREECCVSEFNLSEIECHSGGGGGGGLARGKLAGA